MPDEGPYGIGSDVWPGLAKLVEEMGELTQVLMKLMAKNGHGDEEHWDGKGRLIDRIEDESGDVQAALEFFLEVNSDKLNGPRINKRIAEKLAKFYFWHAEQRAESEKAAVAAKERGGRPGGPGDILDSKYWHDALLKTRGELQTVITRMEVSGPIYTMTAWPEAIQALKKIVK